MSSFSAKRNYILRKIFRRDIPKNITFDFRIDILHFHFVFQELINSGFSLWKELFAESLEGSSESIVV
jgi:hypothetical protein